MKFKTAALAAATVAAIATTLALTAVAQVPQEAAIRKALGERLNSSAKIDEVNKAPIAGLFEVRIGNDVFYTDARAPT
ncbi:hypothetical protein Y694_04478 [Methylibium sp. T29-B]|nr:hypothetical protein Y694_04478 [Methylibium sp. T29-B]